MEYSGFTLRSKSTSEKTSASSPMSDPLMAKPSVSTYLTLKKQNGKSSLFNLQRSQLVECKCKD